MNETSRPVQSPRPNIKLVVQHNHLSNKIEQKQTVMNPICKFGAQHEICEAIATIKYSGNINSDDG